MPELTQLLDTLEARYGPQLPEWPTDPFLFLIWWYCGYPASDAACAKGWEALGKVIALDADQSPAEQLLAAKPARLALALKAGGMFPELRATRLKEAAERIQKEFGDDLPGALRGMPIAKARAALKKFHSIADPGADRILLFAGISPVGALPSNCLHVLARIRLGQEGENWNKTYRVLQEIVAAETPAKFDARIRAYLLLKRHGREVCKLSKPKCTECVAAGSCAYVKGRQFSVGLST